MLFTTQFIAEVKDDSWASGLGLRLEADEQLRRRYIMLSDSPLPRLWGLSLRGHKSHYTAVPSSAPPRFHCSIRIFRT